MAKNQTVEVPINDYIDLKNHPPPKDISIEGWVAIIVSGTVLLTFIWKVISSFAELKSELKSNTKTTTEIQSCLVRAENGIHKELEEQKEQITDLRNHLNRIDNEIINIKGVLSRRFKGILGLMRGERNGKE